MTDRITLTGLEVFAHHGVFDFERDQGQTFIIDCVVELDLSPAGASDELTQTVHYGELAGRLYEAARTEPVDLIETLAERLAATALEIDAVDRVIITVHKPDAPIPLTFTDVSVTIERSRND